MIVEGVVSSELVDRRYYLFRRFLEGGQSYRYSRVEESAPSDG